MEGNEARIEQSSKPKNKAAALLEVLAVSFKLGLTSFGGPVAHLGYFHNEYIERRKWMDERSYADLVALCQFLPGPASSQVGIGIGVIRSGLLGGMMAWLGFTLPSVIALVVFALILQSSGLGELGWIHGLKLVAVAIVAQAVLGMGQKLANSRSKATIAILAASTVLLWQSAVTQVLVIIVAGSVGLLLYRHAVTANEKQLEIPIRKVFAASCLLLFFVLLILLPVATHYANWDWLVIFDSFYRAGSLVFGGGHVVLPLLEQEVVPSGLISEGDFLAGYGAAQAVPGPLFTFAAYLGAMMNGIAGAIVATIAIFLPAFLLVIGALPFWNQLRRSVKMQGALHGMNAAVVGILLAALYDPIWTTTIATTTDFVVAALLFVMLVFWKLPPWVVVVAGMLGGAVMAML
ncbi:chromate transporter [Paenibacillus camelliae]|uniref:chromate transporter n=1 Tax=Paenibacillus camelliae TaxID=512410 RepID=UPI0020420535|nr:chromate transporter [Paenibacillus camelliae]MCM3634897.1 chromate transporter [Paenibacillus camelliae]